MRFESSAKALLSALKNVSLAYSIVTVAIHCVEIQPFSMGPRHWSTFI